MTQENDKLNIPEKYLNMSVSEIRQEKSRLLETIRKKPIKHSVKSEKSFLLNL